MASRCKHQHLTHRFSPGSKFGGGAVVAWLTCWIVSYDSCDMEHAAPGSVLRASRSSNASSGLPGPPTGGQDKDGRIHNDSSRYSTAAQREVASLYLYICCHHVLYVSALCWRVELRLNRPSSKDTAGANVYVDSTMMVPSHIHDNLGMITNVFLARTIRSWLHVRNVNRIKAVLI